MAARGRQIETDGVPIRYVAELIGANMESEGPSDQMAHGFDGAVLRPARYRADGRGFGTAINRCLKPHLIRDTFHSCRADAIERQSA